MNWMPCFSCARVSDAPTDFSSRQNQRGVNRWSISNVHRRQERGIYQAEFDPATGTLTEPEPAGKTSNPPSWRSTESSLPLRVQRDGGFRGEKSGRSAPSPSSRRPGVSRSERAAIAGTYPCHLIVDREGRNALCANYGSGSVAVLRYCRT